MENAKSKFHFFQPLSVTIKDINYGGHVGNDVILSYFQEGRLSYFKQFGYSEMNIGGNGIILVKAEVEYKAELFHQDKINIYCRVSAMKNTSFVLDYLIEKEPDIVACIGKTVLVSFNYQERKITRIPDEFRNKIQEFEGI